MKRIPPFRNRRDVFYLVHEEPTKYSENGIYIVKPKDNSYRAIWAVVWDVPLKLMSTSDGYTKEEVDKIISTIKDYQKENDKLLENIKLEISKLNSKKADRTELANVVAGLVPMGSVSNLAELETKPKRNNDSYYVEDQLSPEGDAYIYRWDDGLNLWVNTKQVVFKDVARISNINTINVSQEYLDNKSTNINYAISIVPEDRRKLGTILRFHSNTTKQFIWEEWEYVGNIYSWSDINKWKKLNTYDYVINATVEYPLDENSYYDIEGAVASIPPNRRQRGLIVSFERKKGVWETWQHSSDSDIKWNSIYWNRISTDYNSDNISILKGDTKLGFYQIEDERYYNETVYSRLIRECIGASIKDITITGLYNIDVYFGSFFYTIENGKASITVFLYTYAKSDFPINNTTDNTGLLHVSIDNISIEQDCIVRGAFSNDKTGVSGYINIDTKRLNNLFPSPKTFGLSARGNNLNTFNIELNKDLIKSINGIFDTYHGLVPINKNKTIDVIPFIESVKSIYVHDTVINNIVNYNITSVSYSKNTNRLIVILTIDYYLGNKIVSVSLRGDEIIKSNSNNLFNLQLNKWGHSNNDGAATITIDLSKFTSDISLNKIKDSKHQFLAKGLQHKLSLIGLYNFALTGRYFTQEANYNYNGSCSSTRLTLIPRGTSEINASVRVSDFANVAILDKDRKVVKWLFTNEDGTKYSGEPKVMESSINIESNYKYIVATNYGDLFGYVNVLGIFPPTDINKVNKYDSIVEAISDTERGDKVNVYNKELTIRENSKVRLAEASSGNITFPYLKVGEPKIPEKQGLLCSIYNGEMFFYNHYSCEIYSSIDEGKTFKTITNADIHPNVWQNGVMNASDRGAVIPLSNGDILFPVCRENDKKEKYYSLYRLSSTGDISKCFEFSRESYVNSDGNNAFSMGAILSNWSYDTFDNLVVVTEYGRGTPKYWNNLGIGKNGNGISSCVWVSFDYGLTWSCILNLDKKKEGTSLHDDNWYYFKSLRERMLIHIHIVRIDKYSNKIWMSNGDGPSWIWSLDIDKAKEHWAKNKISPDRDPLYTSTDTFPIWNRQILRDGVNNSFPDISYCNFQMTGIFPTLNGLLLGHDGNRDFMFYLDKSNYPTVEFDESVKSEPIFDFEKNMRVTDDEWIVEYRLTHGFIQNFYQKDANSPIYALDNAYKSHRIWATWDGFYWHLVFDEPSSSDVIGFGSQIFYDNIHDKYYINNGNKGSTGQEYYRELKMI